MDRRAGARGGGILGCLWACRSVVFFLPARPRLMSVLERLSEGGLGNGRDAFVFFCGGLWRFVEVWEYAWAAARALFTDVKPVIVTSSFYSLSQQFQGRLVWVQCVL